MIFNKLLVTFKLINIQLIMVPFHKTVKTVKTNSKYEFLCSQMVLYTICLMALWYHSLIIVRKLRKKFSLRPHASVTTITESYFLDYVVEYPCSKHQTEGRLRSSQCTQWGHHVSCHGPCHPKLPLIHSMAAFRRYAHAHGLRHPCWGGPWQSSWSRLPTVWRSWSRWTHQRVRI